jgi:phosphomevalonate kinase
VSIYAGVSTASDANNQTALATLQTRAEQAEPRDRCYLYAEIVSRMTDIAGQQLNSGDSALASETLKQVQQYAEKMQSDIGDDSKKLKDSEMLVRRTAFRLHELLHAASYEDRPALESTLNQLDKIGAQLMMRVFKK